MPRFISTLILVLLIPCIAKSQVIPTEGSSLNYRIIGFSFPVIKQAKKYKIEIAAGNYNVEKDFKKNVIKTAESKDNKIIIEVPSFGSQYSWRIAYGGGNSKTTYSSIYHFSTSFIPNVDTAVNRLRIEKKAEKYKDAYVFMDGTRAMYDMNGNPVWFLPNIDGAINANSPVRDLKHTPQGTITFITGEQGDFAAYEINYNGEVLWKGPNDGKVSGGKTEDYHHEFTRQADGHYFILGNEWLDVFLKISAKKDSSLVVGSLNTHPSDTLIKIDRKPFGTLIEYDKTGNVAWYYKSSEYFNQSDLINHRDKDGKISADVHDNAFFFDEKEKAAYISFKEISRIIKVKYPEGTVINAYGETYGHGIREKNNGLFCAQHCCRRSEEGYLYVFNNNSCNLGSNPKITMMQEPVSPSVALKKVWEYECTDEGLTEKQKNKQSPSLGGSVSELPDHSIFACTGSSHCSVFIVNQDKHILWKAIPEMWDKNNKEWILLSQYRADIIPVRAQLEQMIWAAGTE